MSHMHCVDACQVHVCDGSAVCVCVCVCGNLTIIVTLVIVMNLRAICNLASNRLGNSR